MKVPNLLLIIATILLFLTPYSSIASRGIKIKPISPAGNRVSGNQWLFVIGIDTYLAWPRLETAVNDAKSVKDVLLSKYHFNNEHLVELYDENATRANILNKLRFLAKNLAEDDSLFIFYAGHGHFDTITKSGSWIPVESGMQDVSAWISNNDIKNYLRIDAIKAKHILLVSDSCFSGDFFRGHRGKLPEVTDVVIKKAYNLSSRQAITSGGLEPVSDAGFGKNSVFSYFLLKALKENREPFLVPSSFFTDIKAGVAQNAEQFPQFGSLKDTGGQQGGELVLFLKQDSRLIDLSDITNQKQREFEQLKQMEAEAEAASKKEAEELAKMEKELAELDSKIQTMKKRLGTTDVTTDDSLDNMLAMVRQKEKQKKRLDVLRMRKAEDERKRKEEIAKLRAKRDEKIIASLTLEIEKYKEIIHSEYGKTIKSEAWKGLITQLPQDWIQGVEEGDIDTIILSPTKRKMIDEEKRRKEQELIAEQQKELEKILSFVGKKDSTIIAKALEICPINKVLMISNNKLSKPFDTINSAIKISKSEDIIIVGNGKYYEEINLANKKNLVFVSTNAIIITKSPDETIFNIENSQNIGIYGFHLVHETAKYCGANCFRLDGSEFIRIYNCNIEGSGKVGVFLYESSNVKIINNKIHDCEEGVGVNKSTKNTLKNNQFYNNSNNNIKIYNNKNTAFINDWRKENSLN